MAEAEELADVEKPMVLGEATRLPLPTGGGLHRRARILTAVVAALGCVEQDPAGLSDSSGADAAGKAKCRGPTFVVAVTPDTLGLESNGTVGALLGQYMLRCVVRDTSWVWTVSDTLVVAPITDVDGTVTVTPRAAGTAWVKGRVGALADSSRVSVTAPPQSCPPAVAVTPDTLGLMANGTVGSLSGQYSFNCAVRDTSWVWTVSDTFVVAAISEVGGAVTLTPRAAGTAWVKGSVGELADSTRVRVEAAPETCSPTATHLCPGDPYQAKVDAQASGTAFTLGAGTFQFFQIVPRQGQTFTGIWGQTILDGGKQLTGFVSTGSGSWGIGGQTQEGRVGSQLVCQAGFPRCQRPELLWVDDVLKVHVAAKADVGPGKWYFDYANDSIHVGDDPAGRTVWTSVTENAVAASVSGVTLKGLTVQHYAVWGQGNGVIEARGDSWTVDSVVSCRNSGSGIRAENGDKIQIRWGRYCNNGQYGISAGDGAGDGTLDSLLVYGVEVDSNCTQGIERGYGCGAMKVTESSNFTFSRGDIHHNFGNGWWVDIDNVNSRLDSSLVRFNWGTGAQCEISYGCVIAYNTVEDNGQQPKDVFQNGAAILCVASEDCWIHHNTVQRNAHGINTLQQNRAGHIVADALVEHNVITSNRGTTGYKGAYEPALHHTGRNNVWGCNTHNMSGTAAFVFENRQQTDAAWTGAGHDTPCGTINRN